MANVINGYNKLLIPFQFVGNSYKNITQQVVIKNGKSISKWELYNHRLSHVFPSVANILDDGDDDNIGLTVRLNTVLRGNFGLPNKPAARLCIDSPQLDSSVAHEISISNIFLHMFETRVGFVEIEIEHYSKDIDDVNSINYFLAEVKSTRAQLYYTKAISKTEQVRVDVDLLSVITSLLGDLEGVVGMDGQGITAVNADIHTYGVYILDNAIDDIESKLTVMANSFKSTYKSRHDTLDTVRAFDNSYWASSARSVCNISHFIEDGITNYFFANTFVANTKQHYFVLYLLSLNRYYTLCKRLGQMSAMNSKRNIDSEQEIAETKAFVLDLKRKNDLFDLRCCFDVVSSIKHINDVYSMYNSALNIGALTGQCQTSSKALDGLAQYYSDKHEQAREERSAVNNILIFIIAQILGSFSLYKSVCDVLLDSFDISVYEQRIWILLPLGIVVIFFASMTLQIIKKVREYKHMRITNRGQL